ncbi:MAG: AAA family ATPase, partial [Solirubrobacterales bacterium]
MIEATQTRIERPELTGRLVDSLERGSLVLIADAGFGKTIALEQALARREGAAVWLRAASPDRDPGRLVARLVEAIRSELPGVAEDYAERFAGALEPLDAEAIARSLVEDLERLLVEPLVIAIDDAEQLEGSGALAVLESMLAGSRELVRVGICSRRPLGLKLARLKASGRLSELGPADLAFSPAECAACLHLLRGGEPTGEEVEGLFAATEGWPLGVALAAAAGPGPEQLPARGREAIFGYLAEEVFDSLEPELKEALLTASIVDELDADVEDALGLPESFRTEIEEAGVFVRSIGDSYALHPLLREFLRTHLAERSEPAGVPELHLRVAGALASSGRTAEAIDHWLTAEEFESAADAIAAHGIPMAATAPETVTRWLDQLPAELRDRPVLRLLAGRAAMGAGDFDAAVEHCRAGVSELESQQAPEALLWGARLALTDAQIAALDLEAAAEASAGAGDAGPEAGPPAVFCALLH